MNKNEMIAAKGFIFGVFLKKNSNLTKAYMCLFVASFYGIRAAREANTKADEALVDLNTERQRPVIVVEP